MQYFSFLGLGDPQHGYEEVIYSFEDDANQVTVSRFVQKAIIEKYQNQIDEVIIFVTKESIHRYKDKITKEIDNIKLKLVEVSINVEFDEFIDKMISILKPNESFLMDITHSFRNIPMKLLFALRYIELSSNVTLKHLYYGKLISNSSEGVIIDFVKNYRLQIISDLLSQFDRSLILSSKDVERIVEIDQNIKSFLNALSSFNDMIELCEFNRSISVIDNIIDNCNAIQKKQEYILIIPLVKKIKDKFSVYCQKVKIKDKKVELIKIMLCHNRHQIATTFTDQFLREELIHFIFEPYNRNFDINHFKLNGIQIKDNDIYAISQLILTKIRKNIWINKDNRNEKYYNAVLKQEMYLIRCEDLVLNSYKNTISSFYDNIRNHMNHGVAIKHSDTQMKKERIENSIFKILECINKLEKVWKNK